jgi:hypothetical protein
MMVDVVETGDAGEQLAVSPAVAVSSEASPAEPVTSRPPAPAPAQASPPSVPPALDSDQVQQIVASIRDLFGRAALPPRWPMYVRQLKQYLRGVDQNFDEHKWGFGSIMEFLRVVQREGLLRLERDRRGQIRVFPGSALPAAASGVAAPVSRDEQPEPVEEISGNVLPPSERILEEPADEEPADTEVSAPEIFEMDEPQPAPPKARSRTRKAPTAGKPAARKPTGARTPTGTRTPTRRRKTPAA